MIIIGLALTLDSVWYCMWYYFWSLNFNQVMFLGSLEICVLLFTSAILRELLLKFIIIWLWNNPLIFAEFNRGKYCGQSELRHIQYFRNNSTNTYFMKITHNCMKFITMMSVIFHENKDTQTNRFPQQTLHCCQKIGPYPPWNFSKQIDQF